MCNGRSTEPSLDELFGDAAMRILLGRDGVTESNIRALLSKLKDAPAVTSGETKRAGGAYKSGADTPDRTETVLSIRAGKSSEAGKNHLRFI